MRRIVVAVVAAGFMAAGFGAVEAQEAPSGAEEQLASKLNMMKGPCIGDMGSVAQIQVPPGHVFAGAADTKILMELMHNPVSGEEMGFLKPTNTSWFLVFEYDNCGYVKDDEKDKLDASAMLDSIKRGNEEGNKERRRRGWATLAIMGWQTPPRYNKETHRLEWAIRGESEGEPVVNFNTRLLGRQGVMKVAWVGDPASLDTAIPEMNTLLGGFEFKEGKKYAEFRPGDKIAEYGLTALVVGGGAAVAVKTGMFKWLWKAIVIGIVAIGAFLKKIFGGRAQ